MMDKKELRALISSRIAALSPEKKRLALRHLAIVLDVFIRRHYLPETVIMGYYPLPDEPDIVPLLAMILENGYRLCLPVITPHNGMEVRAVSNLNGDLVSNSWKILEPSRDCPPVDPVEIGMVIVPGRAFTVSGGRLGRGKGFYDRFLLRTPARRVALAFKCQIFAETELPQEEHDVRMHEVFSA